MKTIYYAVINDSHEVLTICETRNGASRFADKLEISACTVPTFEGFTDAKAKAKAGTPYKAVLDGHFWTITE